MTELKIAGNTRLQGKAKIHGAKNAILPIMAATILADDISVIHNVPKLTDVDVMCEILRYLNCKVEREDHTLTIDSSGIVNVKVPEYLTKRMRASNLIWGALIGRFKEASIPMPGGCLIGSRPMDYHIKGMRQLGVIAHEHYGQIDSWTPHLKGAEIYLDFPSVGATENLIMAAVKAEGSTVIRNVAKEPEIVDLCNFLNQSGARISGVGNDTLYLEAVEKLHGIEYSVIPDRIVAGTVLLGAAITRGDVTIFDCCPEHLEPLVAKMREAGVKINRKGTELRLKGINRIKPIDLKTLPYPGFPTDIQPQFMSLLTLAEGTSIVCESIFENRFNHCDELRRMGADIRVEGRLAIVKGVREIEGAQVEAFDLRGGAALLLAGMAAEGETRLQNVHHIDRGYCDIEDLFNGLGAKISRVEI